MTVRTMRFFSRASVEGAVHRLFKSAASVTNDARAAVGAGVVASWAAILPSTSATCVSALFQRASNSTDHKPVGRIGGIVLTEGPIDGKARRFKIALERIAHLVPPLAGFRLCRDGSRNSAGADDGEKRILDGVVDAQAAKGNAARLAIVHPAATAA